MTSTHLLLLLASCMISCKQGSTVAELGKHVPNYTFSNIQNSNESEISLHDLRGNTVILEFWATWCSACIPAMKKLDSLQSEFKDDLEIITIALDSKERIDKFITSSNTSLRIVSDTAHRAHFSYRVIPHSIVIDKNGIVRAITSPENIDRGVLSEFITTDEIDLEVKDDFYVDPNAEVRTIRSLAAADYSIELKSYDATKGSSTTTLTDIEGNVDGLEIWNSTLPGLFRDLFEVGPSRVVYSDGLSADDFPFEEEYRYSMTIEVSDEYQNNWRALGIDFLNEHFDVNARRGIDSLDGFVLRDVDITIEQSSANNFEFMSLGGILVGKKMTMSHLAEYLENAVYAPVLDQTNLSGEYDIELDWQEIDPKTLHQELRKYGLQLKKSDEKLPVEVMEIYQKK